MAGRVCPGAQQLLAEARALLDILSEDAGTKAEALSESLADEERLLGRRLASS